MVTPFPACFLTAESSPPLPRTALRSQTLSTPVTRSTKGEAAKSPGTARSAGAPKVSSGKPCARQNARRPRLVLLAGPGCTPCARPAARRSAARKEGGKRRLQRGLGRSPAAAHAQHRDARHEHAARPSVLGTQGQRRTSPSAPWARTHPGRRLARGAAMAVRRAIAVPPARSLADTRRMAAARPRTAQPCRTRPGVHREGAVGRPWPWSAPPARRRQRGDAARQVVRAAQVAAQQRHRKAPRTRPPTTTAGSDGLAAHVRRDGPHCDARRAHKDQPVRAGGRRAPSSCVQRPPAAPQRAGVPPIALRPSAAASSMPLCGERQVAARFISSASPIFRRRTTGRTGLLRS